MNNKGFTLIELIIVVVLLGLLAAVALPKFSDLESKARSASEQGIIGALRSAIGISHADWLANSKTSPITLEGVTFHMSAEGYPTSTTAAGNTVTYAKCLEIFQNILTGAPESGTTCTGTCKIKVTANDADNTQCFFDFDQGATGKTRAVYDVNTGAVTETTVP